MPQPSQPSSNSAEAITNVYPILQSFELAFGYLPQAATLASMVQSALSVSQLCSAIVASQTFANVYDGGTIINPNSPVTASIVDISLHPCIGTRANVNRHFPAG